VSTPQSAAPVASPAVAGARDLLFDLDGTLCDSFPGIAACIGHALAQLARATPPDAALRACVGPPLRSSFARLLGTTDAALLERAVALYRERYAAHGWRENSVYPGIGEALATLHARGTRLFLCTVKPEVYARRILAHFGLAARFRRVYGPDLAGHLDDKTQLIATLIERERVDPAAAVMIGDRAGDVAAAKAHGMPAVGVLWGYGTRGELAGADLLVDAPAALPAALLPA
jgi:phosphoglycolate phosphatase